MDLLSRDHLAGSQDRRGWRGRRRRRRLPGCRALRYCCWDAGKAGRNENQRSALPLRVLAVAGLVVLVLRGKSVRSTAVMDEATRHCIEPLVNTNG